jgi:putative phage-type endonuclease
MLSLAQLKMRQTGITATDIGVLSGENPYSSPVIVYEDKFQSEAQLIAKADEDPSDAALNGHVFEPALAERYVMDMAEPLVIVSSPDTYRATDCEWALATPDRFVFRGPDAAERGKQGGVANWLLECKLVGTRASYNWDLDADTDADRLPPYVYTQVQWQMRVLGYDRCDVAALIYGTTFKKFHINRDDQYIESLQAIADAFWTNHVLKRVPPEPDGTPAYGGFLSRRFGPNRVDTQIEAPPEAEQLVRAYADCSRMEAESKEEKRRIRQTLHLLAGSSSGFEGPWGKVSCLQHKGKVSWAKLAKGEGIGSDVTERYRDEPYTSVFIRPAKKKEEVF